MTIQIHQQYGGWAKNGQRSYKEGETVPCEVSAYWGTATEAATLKALAQGEGFLVKRKGKKTKIVDAGDSIWTSLGDAEGT